MRFYLNKFYANGVFCFKIMQHTTNYSFFVIKLAYFSIGKKPIKH